MKYKIGDKVILRDPIIRPNYSDYIAHKGDIGIIDRVGGDNHRLDYGVAWDKESKGYAGNKHSAVSEENLVLAVIERN